MNQQLIQELKQQVIKELDGGIIATPTLINIEMAPEIESGDVIWVDPSIQPQSGQYVIVKTKNNEHAVRRFPVNENDTLLGVVTGRSRSCLPGLEETTRN